MIICLLQTFAKEPRMGDSNTKRLGPDAGQDIPKCDDEHPQPFHVGVLPRQGHRL